MITYYGEQVRIRVITTLGIVSADSDSVTLYARTPLCNCSSLSSRIF